MFSLLHWPKCITLRGFYCNKLVQAQSQAELRLGFFYPYFQVLKNKNEYATSIERIIKISNFIKKKYQKCLDQGSNQWPLDLQSNALPTELSRLDTLGIIILMTFSCTQTKNWTEQNTSVAFIFTTLIKDFAEVLKIVLFNFQNVLRFGDLSTLFSVNQLWNFILSGPKGRCKWRAWEAAALGSIS